MKPSWARVYYYDLLAWRRQDPLAVIDLTAPMISEGTHVDFWPRRVRSPGIWRLISSGQLSYLKSSSPWRRTS